MNPYIKRPIGSAAQQSIQRIVSSQLKIQRLEVERKVAMAERAGAVATALAAGASLRDIGATLNVSPETVRLWGQSGG